MPSRSDPPANLPILVPGQPEPSFARRRSGTAFAAQALGAGGEKRGLRGGRPVLQAARAAYLDAQWRGEGERRATPGLLRIARA